MREKDAPENGPLFKVKSRQDVYNGRKDISRVRRSGERLKLAERARPLLATIDNQ